MPTGCSIVYIYWMRSLGYTIPQIVQAAGTTLAANYQALTGRSSAYQDLLAAVSGLSVTSDNPFGQQAVQTWHTVIEPTPPAGVNFLNAPPAQGSGQAFASNRSDGQVDVYYFL